MKEVREMNFDCIWTERYRAELKEMDPDSERFLRVVKHMSSLTNETVMRMLSEGHFAWNERYATGVAKIDRHHKKRLRMMQKIYLTLCQSADHSRVDKLLRKFRQSLQKQFQAEERLMRRSGLPSLAEQEKDHRLLLAELDKHIEALQRSQGAAPKLLYFLLQWFLKHSTSNDREFGAYMRQQSRVPRSLVTLFRRKSPAFGC